MKYSEIMKYFMTIQSIIINMFHFMKTFISKYNKGLCFERDKIFRLSIYKLFQS